jgi:hypothetical protein
VLIGGLSSGCQSLPEDTSTDEPGLEVTLTDFQYRTCWEDVSGSERVTASHAGTGAIAVLHEVELEDCTTLTASALADEARLQVDYTREVDGDCESICWFRVDFMLTGVPAGTWTVAIEDGPTSAVIVP